MSELIPIYSISKPFLAEAVLALNIPLNDQIGSHLSGLQDCYSRRVISELLNHTSGLDDYCDISEYKVAVRERVPAWDRDFLLEIASTREHNHQGFHYSNIGYLLLAMLVEKECSSTYFGAISELVLRPLRINGFHEWKSPHPQIPDYDPNWVYSGTVLSSPQAIAPSLLTLAQHRDESIGLNAGITQLSYPNTGFEAPGYGYGFMLDGGGADSPPRYVGHGGGGPGFNLMALVSTSDWKAEAMYSVTDFDQQNAITSLIHRFNEVV